jgi:hypothetical protein
MGDDLLNNSETHPVQLDGGLFKFSDLSLRKTIADILSPIGSFLAMKGHSRRFEKSGPIGARRGSFSYHENAPP